MRGTPGAIGTLSAADIEIGAVEIKDATSDTRATVGSNGLHVDVRAIQAGDNNIGNIDIVTFPSGNLGQQLMASSLSIVPASDIIDATYIGDIKFGEALPTGSNVIGAVTQSGTWNIGTLTSITNSVAVTGTFWQATQPVSIAAGTNIIGRVGHDITGIGHGVKTVTVAGTDEALAGSTACKKVDLQSQTDNTGLIAIGGSGVDATESTGTGIILYPGDVYSLEIDNLADIFVDATVSGEGVRYCYYS